MTKKERELAAKIAEYKELKALAKEAEDAMKKIEDALKKEMDRKKVDEMEIGDFKVRWTPFVTKKFDSKGFKAAEPEMYAEWSKEVESRRFSVA